MIQAHGFDSWLTPAAKTGAGYAVIRHLSGLPSRLFLLLAGVSVAIRWEAQLAKGGTDLRRPVAIRGLQIVGLAYLFRFQEHALAGFRGDWTNLIRVDILNAIGASLLLVALVATPRHGRPAIVPTLLVAGALVIFGPIVGPAHFPTWLPSALTSYIGGQRPMSWFPLFPWGAWALLGVALGHLWMRQRHRQARCFLLTGTVGLAMTGSVIAVRAIDPQIISYPSELVQQMGPGSFFYRLGLIGALAALSWAVTLRPTERFSPMRQLGQTSLLIYWIHVDICYGYLTRPIQHQLGIPAATVWILALCLLMLGVSWAKTRYWRRRVRA